MNTQFVLARGSLGQPPAAQVMQIGGELGGRHDLALADAACLLLQAVPARKTLVQV